jgi:putative Mn2+ efflux pump MntP
MTATHLRARDVALVAQWDHWIAFGLRFALGVKRVWESRGELDKVEAEPFQLRVLLVLAVATSIDALAAGLTLPTLDAPIVVSIALA